MPGVVTVATLYSMASSASAPATFVDPASPPWRRPGPGRRGYRADAITAVVLFAATLVSAWLYATVAADPEIAPAWVTVLWAAVIALPLAVRRRAPEIVALVVAAAFVSLVPLRVPELLFCNICLFVALYSIGAWSPNRRRATWLRGIIVIGMFAWLFGDLYFRSLDPEMLPQLSRTGTVSPFAAFGLIQIIINLLYFGAAWYFGESAFAAARQRVTLEQRTVELADERGRTAAQAVTIERVRIARELHDVVAHHVSVMGVQAGAARRILERDPAAASVALTHIEQSARSAIDDLHRMLGTLREDGQPDAPPAAIESSTRGIEQLPDLVEEAVLSGLPAALTIVGEPHAVPATVGLSIYRIAQEAITNTRKHAGASATVEVRLRYRGAGGVELEVSDTGVGRSMRSRPSATARHSGLGQVGMRERVAATGGTIEFGSRPGGGYLVRASFPAGVLVE